MKTYLVCTPNFYVEAESIEEAQEKARERVDNCDIDFDITLDSSEYQEAFDKLAGDPISKLNKLLK